MPYLYLELPLALVTALQAGAVVSLLSMGGAPLLGSRFALHGVLAAAVASLIDIGVVQMAGESVRWLYWASHGLRLLGATAGGLVVERGART